MKLYNQTNYIHGSIKEGEGKCLTTEELVNIILPGETTTDHTVEEDIGHGEEEGITQI